MSRDDNRNFSVEYEVNMNQYKSVLIILTFQEFVQYDLPEYVFNRTWVQWV